MKTTVELPDDLLVAAKQRAAALRKPLRALVEQGLRTVLGEGWRSKGGLGKMKWVVAEGGAPAKTADRDALYAQTGEGYVVVQNDRPIGKFVPGAPRMTALEVLEDLHNTLDDEEGASWLKDAVACDRPLPREPRDPWA